MGWVLKGIHRGSHYSSSDSADPVVLHYNIEVYPVGKGGGSSINKNWTSGVQLHQFLPDLLTPPNPLLEDLITSLAVPQFDKVPHEEGSWASVIIWSDTKWNSASYVQWSQTTGFHQDTCGTRVKRNQRTAWEHDPQNQLTGTHRDAQGSGTL